MRIRRRPQQPSPSSSSSSPSFWLLHSDPSTSTAPQQTPRNAERSQERRAGLEGGGGGGSEEQGERRPPHLHANADLGQKSAVARRLALPQDNAVGSPGAEQEADDLHRRGLVNGHGGADWTVACTGQLGEQAVKMEGPVQNGLAAPAVTMLAVKDETRINGSDGSSGAGGGAKKRRGPAVLLEGSRCSRVNGRGWRCSQPTLVGYSLCEHHLGKGRMRAAATAAAAGGVGRGGPGQLGRTEHRAKIPVAVAIGAVTAASSKAEEPGLGRY